MNALTLDRVKPEIFYPDSDGEPMSENMWQGDRIMTIRGNISAILADDPNAFAAADNFIYPVEGRPEIVVAPDVYVAFGRPKGNRGSYCVWEEGNIFPQVIFEVLSPGNRAGAMERKLEFYERHGAEEYYVDDIDYHEITGYRRDAKSKRFVTIPNMQGFISPRLGMRFVLTSEEVELYRPDGTKFISFEDLDLKLQEQATLLNGERRRAEQERRRAEKERRHAEEHRSRADEERHRADAAEIRNARLLAKLQALGIDPEGNCDNQPD